MFIKLKDSSPLLVEPPLQHLQLVYRPENFTLEEWIQIDARKRTMDVIISALGIIFLLPLLPILFIIIKLTSPGPLFFKQVREGERGIPFLCYKIRTMHISDDDFFEDEPNVTDVGDSRIFKFGHFLRKFNLDELPQLYNVLKGDMSLVGPRPYMVSEAQYWRHEFPAIEFELRDQIKPGITGLAQVNGYRGGILDKNHMRKRLEYDLVYVQSYDNSSDVKIITKTISQMVYGDTNAH